VVLRFVLCAAGLVLLTVAADHLVLGSSRLAQRFKMSPVIVGVVVIGVGTSAPEFLVSGLAAAHGDTGIAVGNIVGSNILNLTLILGVAGLIAPMAVASSVIRREVPLAAAGVVVFGALTLAGLGWITATVLAVLGVAALTLLVRWARTAASEATLAGQVVGFAQPAGTVDMTIDNRRLPAWFEPVRAGLGLAGVLAGAQILVVNASAIAADFGVPSVVIGMTLVAIGTSLPELVTTIQAQRRREPDLVVGNLFGSNLFNSLAGGAIIGFATSGGPVHASAVLLVVMVSVTGLAWALLWRGLILSRIEGAVLIAAYLVIQPLLLAA
jgi:cation:H+ antiporter